jgi:hypothetical protein
MVATTSIATISLACVVAAVNQKTSGYTDAMRGEALPGKSA